MQTRRVTCEAYELDDGLYEIESVLIDSKPYTVHVGDRGAISSGEPFHEMRVRLLIDAQLNIHDIVARTLKAPYTQCREISPSYGALKGLNLGKGFMKQVRQLLGGTAGCTHMTELLSPTVTTAIQTVWHVRDRLTTPLAKRPPLPSHAPCPPEVGQCYAMRPESDAVRRYYPRFHVKPERSEGTVTETTVPPEFNILFSLESLNDPAKCPGMRALYLVAGCSSVDSKLTPQS